LSSLAKEFHVNRLGKLCRCGLPFATPRLRRKSQPGQEWYNKIKAIDNHSHPPKLVSPGEKDDDFDALPCDPLEPTVPTTVSHPDNPQYIAAWKALYGYKYDDASPEHVKELLETKKKVIAEQGDNFLTWVLDQLGIETELANRVAMGRGLKVPRFQWVPFDDALLLPLKNSDMGSDSPDRVFFTCVRPICCAAISTIWGLKRCPQT
jgi:hypothetical protein